MGLAASQARFLAITSRKASCEFQSMQVAQQQLSLSRDMEKISQEYQDAINQTQLVWDPDGNGTDLYNLSYSLMMSPSELNNYEPFMLGRRDGKIALNSSMAAAVKGLEQYGLTEDGFSGTSEQKLQAYAAFIGNLRNEKVASSSSVISYIPDAGLGGELYGREYGGAMTITSLISYIDIITSGAASGAYPVDSDYYKQAEDLTFAWGSYTKGTGTNPDVWTEFDLGENWSGVKDKGAAILINGNYNNDAFNLADLLNEDITLLVKDSKNYNTLLDSLRSVLKNSSDNSAFDTLINNDPKTWYDALNGSGSFDALDVSSKTLLTYVDTLAKGMFSLLMPKDYTSTDLNAFYMAMDDIISRLSMDKVNDLGGKGLSESNGKNAVQEAENYNTWVKKGNTYALSLSNLTEAFMTNFVNGMDSYTGSYGVFDKVKDTYYITDNPGYIYEVNSGEEIDKDYYESEFYSIIFNTICQNGWYENEYVDDKDYLDNAIKTGQLFVVSRGSDNYYYQERYININGGHIMENTDSDAIARAEREYTIKKSKINTKEEQLEIETKQLDAEIASLTAEYDTVKNLISKNIEKTFSLFNE